jgi:hypothetical protein
MTLTDPQVLQPYTPVVVDLYRDIHKGLRVELFDVTLLAGRTDPGDRDARSALAARVDELAEMLVAHAHHEDPAIQPPLELHRPELAEKIASDHARIEARIGALRELAADVVAAGATEWRVRTNRLYLELASFTGTYLEHQDVEERIVMPALEATVGVEGVGVIKGQILGGIPPAEMAATLPKMLAAMNVDDRVEVLGGMRANAPAEVFAGIWGLTQSVLNPADFGQLAGRLGLS